MAKPKLRGDHLFLPVPTPAQQAAVPSLEAVGSAELVPVWEAARLLLTPHNQRAKSQAATDTLTGRVSASSPGV